MLKIIDLPIMERWQLLETMNFGHLGCSADGQPYIVPMHYAYDGNDFYFLTTEGLKTEWLEKNQKVCFQVEKIRDERHWQSVVVLGTAERLEDAGEISRAARLIYEKHASLAPAISIRVLPGGDDHFNRAVVYRIRLDTITGRQTKHL